MTNICEAQTDARSAPLRLQLLWLQRQICSYRGSQSMSTPEWRLRMRPANCMRQARGRRTSERWRLFARPGTDGRQGPAKKPGTRHGVRQAAIEEPEAVQAAKLHGEMLPEQQAGRWRTQLKRVLLSLLYRWQSRVRSFCLFGGI